MTEKFNSREALADKIDWEGGVSEAVDYGISAEELPDGTPQEVIDAWERVAGASEDVRLIYRWLAA